MAIGLVGYSGSQCKDASSLFSELEIELKELDPGVWSKSSLFPLILPDPDPVVKFIYPGISWALLNFS